MAKRPTVPKFGTWDSGDAGYTAYFDKVRENKGATAPPLRRPRSPNDPDPDREPEPEEGPMRRVPPPSSSRPATAGGHREPPPPGRRHGQSHRRTESSGSAPSDRQSKFAPPPQYYQQQQRASPQQQPRHHHGGGGGHQQQHPPRAQVRRVGRADRFVGRAGVHGAVREREAEPGGGQVRGAGCAARAVAAGGRRAEARPSEDPFRVQATAPFVFVMCRCLDVSFPPLQKADNDARYESVFFL
ncbi:hypothetical protein ZEAMMB73_Zm00001d036772 [Zea mays]|uniref:RIN4 pathogenic type III effector avirulence factor Avr cleavage site domain-containing protein n=1 Tax=Zea mays TaxID=4577 RepID=A0A1D6LR23_MAIZE|nr:hypothetical protein ZEAMMB73_Zm00001d036772 [Zea mays]